MSDQFIGVKPVEERHRIDAGRLADFLKQNLEGFRGPLQVEQFKGGQSNPTYRISAGGKRYALRKKPPGKLLPSAHAVEREFKVIKALHGVGFPVARPYLLCEDDAVLGTPFYLMDCIEGRVLWDQSLPGMSQAQRGAIWEELNRVIALLHSVDYKAVGLEDFGKAGSYIERQVGRWSKQYLASETETIEAMHQLIAWLPKNVPANSETTIVHGDYRLDNTVFHPSEPKVLAVLDWELSTLGDPLADFSYHCMSWHIPPGKFRGIEGLPLAELGIPTEREYAERYFKRSGRKDVEPSVWDYYMAYNLFRIAAILQGIAKRVLDGTAASEHAREAGSRAPLMAELGWKQVEKILQRKT
ncbi:MAG: phosphotransferase family protein [Betaproteobacteria bacterium]|nr:phosphotransferase family protein [Betaproteobacteria bacterium]MSQ89136.1 phosphotransferase family protein [Betaproteobacteria bacterium]